MRILMVTKAFPPRYAGACVQAIYLAKALQTLGLMVDFLSDDYDQKTKNEQYEGINVKKLKTIYRPFCASQVGRIIFSIKAFFYLLKHKEYKIVFMHSVSGFDALLFPLAKILNRKSILELTLINNDDPVTIKKRKFGFIFFSAINCVDVIVAISSKLKDLSIQAGIKPNRIRLIPVGVNTEKFHKLSLEENYVLKNKLNLAGYNNVFVAVGRIEERKEYLFMIRAWKIIKEKFPSSLLLIIGPGNDVKNKYFLDLQREMELLGIKNIRFLGMLGNVSQYMQVSDFLLHCSLNEGLPNALLEAALSEVFIVCRYIDGVTSDIIINSNVGIESNAKNPDDFANDVLSVVSSSSRNIKRDDLIILKDKFDINSVANQYSNLFCQLLEDGRNVKSN